ncbi:MAG: hypothetical protein KY469_17350 [Actinobacteria bacterium]|nr:hypothetical protein [Actinomycetota bacterium]
MDDNGVTQPPEQGTLPLETAADAPIAYELTARARRAVAPDSLPPLEVIPERGDAGTVVLERGDTRAARARALRRAGMSHERIADELDVDELLVRAWCGDIASGRPGRLSVVEQPTAPARVEATPPRPDTAAIRTAARADANDRLDGPTVSFVGGLGLTLARTEVSEHAALIAVADQQVAAATVRWLLDHAGVDPRRLRVVLKIAPELAADVTVHSWAAAMEMDPETLVHTRWRGAPTGDAVEALIRIADPSVAARLAGWREALLDRLGVDARPDATETAPGS